MNATRSKRAYDDGYPDDLRDSTGDGKPVASREDIARAWEPFSGPWPTSGGSPTLDAFLAARGLDPATGRRVGFGVRVLADGSGDVLLGFRTDDGIKVRSLTKADESGRPKRWVEPTIKKTPPNGVVFVPPRSGGTSDTVILCESETDLWALAQRAPDYAYALMPAGVLTWEEVWAVPLRRYARVLIATDSDEAGQEGAWKVSRDLPQALRLRPPPDHKDWCEALGPGGSVTEEALAGLIETAAEPVSFPRLDPVRIIAVAQRIATQIGQPPTSKAVIAETAKEAHVDRATVEALARGAAYPSPELRVYTLGEVLEHEDPDAEDILGNGQLPVGEMLGIIGPAGIGKSLLAHQLALALAYGHPYFLTEAIPVSRPRRVLYVPGEGTSASFKGRSAKLVHAAEAVPGADRANGHSRLLTIGYGAGVGLKLDVEAHLGNLATLIQEHEPEVVILDPIRTFHTKNENASEEMEEVFSILRERIIKRYGVSLIVTHHTRKGAKGDRDAARGGSLQENLGTGWLLLDGPRGTTDLRRLTVTKTRNGADIPSLLLQRDPVTLWHSVTEDASKDTTGEVLDKAAGLLVGRDTLKVPDLLKELDMAPNAPKGRKVKEAMKEDPRFVIDTTKRPHLVSLSAAEGGLP